MFGFLIFDDPLYFFLFVPLVMCLCTEKMHKLNFAFILSCCILSLRRNVLYFDIWILLLLIINKTFEKYIYKQNTNEILFELEKYIYDRDFKLHFTEDEFKLLFSIAQIKKSKNKFEIVKEGEKTDKIIYFATIPVYKSIYLKSKDTFISFIHEGSWLGIVEFIFHLFKSEQTGKNYDSNWLVSINHENEDIVVYYEWDFTSLTNLFKYSNDYLFINKLLIMWLKYLSHSVFRLDDHVANALKVITDEESTNTLPYSKRFIY